MSAVSPPLPWRPASTPPDRPSRLRPRRPTPTIRYTLNGATPTVTDPIFTPGFPLTVGNYTLKAAAFRTGFTTSGVASAAYTVLGNVSDPRIATGATHTLVVKRDGTVWGTGWNGWGNLGDGSTSTRTALVPVAGLTGIRSIAAGAGHSAAVDQDGRLYTWGQNTSRQLGDGTTVSHRTTPTLVTGVPALVAARPGRTTRWPSPAPARFTPSAPTPLGRSAMVPRRRPPPQFCSPACPRSPVSPPATTTVWPGRAEVSSTRGGQRQLSAWRWLEHDADAVPVPISAVPGVARPPPARSTRWSGRRAARPGLGATTTTANWATRAPRTGPRPR